MAKMKFGRPGGDNLFFCFVVLDPDLEDKVALFTQCL